MKGQIEAAHGRTRAAAKAVLVGAAQLVPAQALQLGMTSRKVTLLTIADHHDDHSDMKCSRCCVSHVLLAKTRLPRWPS